MTSCFFSVPKFSNVPSRTAEVFATWMQVLKAVDGNERVVLYGDYDVDGVTSMSLLHLTLKAYGLVSHPFMPHRLAEGYGLSLDGLAHAFEDFGKPDLVVAMDCGTTSVGLAFKVAHAMLKTRMVPGFDLKTCLDLVALGTVADLVPLVGENRLLVRRGLEALAETPRVPGTAMARGRKGQLCRGTRIGRDGSGRGRSGRWARVRVGP